ncbi:hypothetical protein [Glycomyces sp. NPDC048151]|uniref:hypothetical protein n=1 Tax=Glycomyces sp. NPDC048151 TaxID=3364002 RepID=UPI00371541BD
MTHVLAQRKYRFAAVLAIATARTFGLALVAAFIVLAVASAAIRAVQGGDSEMAYGVIQAIPVAMIAIGWLRLARAYPAAITNGMTRKEFLTGFALFGAATVLATAALTQLAVLALDLSPFQAEGVHVGFYGLTPLESAVIPILYFAVGTATGAVMLRFANRWVGAAVCAVLVSAVFYRQLAYYAAMNLFGLQSGGEDGTVFQYPMVDLYALLPYLDLVVALAFALFAWALLARAPMRPKQA